MNRRTLIKSAAASAGVLMMPKTGIIRPRLANAATTANRGVWASLFDGATKLQNDGTVTNLPVSSPYGLMAYFYTYPGSFTSTNQLILGQSTAAGVPNIEIYHLITGKRGNAPNTVLYAIFGTGSTPTTPGVVQANSPAGAIPASGSYSPILVSWDLTVPIVKANVNKTAIQMGISQLVGPYASGPQFNTWGGVPLRWNVGSGISQGGGYFKGNLAEYFFYAFDAPPPDINDPAVQAGFIASNGQPPDFSHRSFDGSHAIGEFAPQIYLSGPGGNFGFSRSAGMSNTGSQTIRDRNNPDYFYVAAGQLQTPAGPGPWGEMGV